MSRYVTFENFKPSNGKRRDAIARRPKKRYAESYAIVRQFFHEHPNEVVSPTHVAAKFGIGKQNIGVILESLRSAGEVVLVPTNNSRKKKYSGAPQSSAPGLPCQSALPWVHKSAEEFKPSTVTLADVIWWLNHGSEIFGQSLTLTLTSRS